MWRTTAVTFCSYSSTSRVTPSSAKRWPQAHWPEYRTGLLGLRAACWREEGGRVLTPLLCHEIKRKTRTNPKAKKKTVRRQRFPMTLLSDFQLGSAPALPPRSPRKSTKSGHFGRGEWIRTTDP